MIGLDGELGVLCDSHILRLEDNIVGIALFSTTEVTSSLILNTSKAHRRKELAYSFSSFRQIILCSS